MEVAMSQVIVKVGGVAAALAGVLIIEEEIRGFVVGISEGIGESAVHSTWLLLLVFGMFGMYLHQQRAAGVFGQIATLVALFGTVTLFGAALTEVTVLPALPKGLIDKPPSALLVVFIGSFVAYVVGLVLFGIATWRARVLSRRAAALLVIGIVRVDGEVVRPGSDGRLWSGVGLAGCGHGDPGADRRDRRRPAGLDADVVRVRIARPH
jgi:hypothetical protein